MINIGCDLGLVFRFINGQSIERFELLGILGPKNTKDTKLGRFYSLPHLSNHAVLFCHFFGEKIWCKLRGFRLAREKWGKYIKQNLDYPKSVRIYAFQLGEEQVFGMHKRTFKALLVA